MFWKLYALTLPIFFGIDMVWLGLVATKFYRQQIGYIMRDTPNWTAAILFYLLFIGGLIVFVIAPAVAKREWLYALSYGALFGFMTYATYDLTNLATVKDWPILVTVVDLIWGSVLAASVSTAVYWAAAKLGL